MKVLYFMNHVDQGGAALALYDLIVELKRTEQGFVPVVITGANNRLNDMFSKIGVENYSSEYKNFLSSYKEPLFLTRPALMVRYEIGKRKGIKRIEELIDFRSIDIIHSNLNRIDIGAILAAKHGIPHVWHIREHANIYTGIVKPCLVSEMGNDFELVSVKGNPIKYMSDFNRVSAKGTHFIAISESVKREWVRKGLAADSIEIIYDGIREELYTSKEYKNNPITNIIFLGGYAKEKGQEELLEALGHLKEKELSSIHIDFFGNGKVGYIEHIRNIAEKYISLGIVSINMYDSEINKKMSYYDVGLNCSNAEGFGRVTVEYMMSGLCPLVSNTGANPEIVTDGIDGIMYKKGDVLDLSNKIRCLMRDKNMIAKLGKRAREKTLAVFSMKSHAKNMNELYNRAIGDL